MIKKINNLKFKRYNLYKAKKNDNIELKYIYII